VIPAGSQTRVPLALDDGTLAAIQEGLRGVVRIPTGTAHALDSRAFPIAVMGKTGTTNEFRDALFVGSTYGIDGITVAVRIGFDDNRSLGPRETGGRVALPVFQELMLKVYRDGIVGPVPAFPDQMEQHITRYLSGDPLDATASATAALEVPESLAAHAVYRSAGGDIIRVGAPVERALPDPTEWLLHHAATVLGPILKTTP
jgi:membrane carboxypeptidase/penicillin-binding protein